MERKNLALDVPYKDKLNIEERERYLNKIKDIDGLDPYEHTDWTEDDFNLLPPITRLHLMQYLIEGTSYYTFNSFKSEKSLQAHVYFTSGWVHSLMIHSVNNNTVIRTMVKHSQSVGLRAKPLEPWVILNEDGSVVSAHCTCVAGLGESCSHVAALLFKMEYIVKLRHKRTVTEEPAYWMIPKVAQVVGQPGNNIDYTSAAAKKKMYDDAASGDAELHMRTRSLPLLPIQPFLTFDTTTGLLPVMLSKGSVGLSTFPSYCDEYEDVVKPCVLPKSLKLLHDAKKVGCELSLLRQHCEGLKDKVAVTATQAAAVEEKTRAQYRSNDWFTVRAGRITASNIHHVAATTIDKPAITTVNRVCNPRPSGGAKEDNTQCPMAWGINHEGVAREAYVRQTESKHTNLSVEPCGFFINTSFPEVGASPDGIILCGCCGKGCLEVKCPFSHRQNSILKACEDKNFCLHTINGDLTLKKTHAYYSQVQTQMFVTESQYCDFVVWTEVDTAVIRVYPDVEFWNELLRKAQVFFVKVCLPELVASHFTRAHKLAKNKTPVSSTAIQTPSQPSTSSTAIQTPSHLSTSTSTSTSSSAIQTPSQPSIPTSSTAQEPIAKRAKENKSTDRKKTNKREYCICTGTGDGTMVRCDTFRCAIKWFHISCVNLDHVPEEREKWYCATCTANKPVCKLTPRQNSKKTSL